MNKIVASLLLFSAGIVIVAEVQIDYTLRIFKTDKARIVRQLALLGGAGSLLGNATALLGGVTNVAGSVPSIVSNPQQAVTNVSSTVNAVTSNPTSAATNAVNGLLSVVPVPVPVPVGNVVALVGAVASNPVAVVGQASALLGNPAGLLTNPTALLSDPTAIVQQVQDLLVGIDLVQELENAVELVFTVAQKQLDGSLLPIAQVPVLAQFDKEEVVQAVLDTANGVQSLTISLLATPMSQLN